MPVEPNRLVKKGEVLFRIDPTPVRAHGQGAWRRSSPTPRRAGASSRSSSAAPAASVAAARGSVQQADARVQEVLAKLEFARKRVEDNRELVRRGAGDRFELEAAETDAKTLAAQLDTARGVLAQARGSEVQAAASERQVRQRIGGKVGTVYAPVAQVRAQLENARWQLDADDGAARPPTATRSTCSCAPGSFTAAFPITPAMTFVENTYQVIALYSQNELHQIDARQRGRVRAAAPIPGRIIKAKVDSIIWAQGQGQVAEQHACRRPASGRSPPGRFAVKLTVDERDADMFLAAGAIGEGAIYTDHLRLPAHPAQGAAAREREDRLPGPEAALSMAGAADRIDGPGLRRRRWLALAAAAPPSPGCALRSPPDVKELTATELAHAPLPANWRAGGLATPKSRSAG